MFKPGDVVMQEKTMVNKVNFKDNKQNRLSIVLFSYEENNKLYYATVPVTNATRGTYNKIISKNHLYMPYSILNDTKFCCAKIDKSTSRTDLFSPYDIGCPVNNRIFPLGEYCLNGWFCIRFFVANFNKFGGDLYS